MQPFKTKWRTRLFVGVIAGALNLGALAETPEEKGFEIEARSDRSDRGFGDSVVTLNMVLRNKAGRESVRSLEIRTLEMPGETIGDRSLLVFESPADIEGTALLSHAKIIESDDQWLYLPALKRTKRISSVNKSGPFVGSEFAFEDLTSQELNKYDYNWLREEAFGELVCDVVERIPRYERSGYSKQYAWIDQSVHQVRRVEFYDHRRDLLKTLTIDEFRDYDGVWRGHRFAMINHQTGKSTDLNYDAYEFDTGVTERDFVKSVLTRLR